MPRRSVPGNDDADRTQGPVSQAPGRRDPDLGGRILAEALRLFDELGFDAVNVNQVAARAGVSPITIYRTFETKAGIVFWPRDQSVMRLRSLASVQPRHPDPRAAVAACLRVHGSTVPIDPATYRVLLRIIEASPRLQVAAHSTVGELERALLDGLGGPKEEKPLDLHVACAAGAAALVVAARRWGHHEARGSWSTHINEALLALWPDVVANQRFDGGGRRGPRPPTRLT